MLSINSEMARQERGFVNASFDKRRLTIQAITGAEIGKGMRRRTGFRINEDPLGIRAESLRSVKRRESLVLSAEQSGAEPLGTGSDDVPNGLIDFVAGQRPFSTLEVKRQQRPLLLITIFLGVAVGFSILDVSQVVATAEAANG